MSASDGDYATLLHEMSKHLLTKQSSPILKIPSNLNPAASYEHEFDVLNGLVSLVQAEPKRKRRRK